MQFPEELELRIDLKEQRLCRTGELEGLLLLSHRHRLHLDPILVRDRDGYVEDEWIVRLGMVQKRQI